MKNIFLILGLSACVLACTQSKKDKVIIDLETSYGKVVIELNRKAAPITVDNFIEYVRSGFYNSTIFHRVIPGFVIQGGGFDKEMTQKPTRLPIKNEASNGLNNRTMTLSMARTNDPHSATSQFFINLSDNNRLDYVEGKSDGYAVFARVIEGESVVNKIAQVSTQTQGFYENVPVEDVMIVRASVRGEK